MAKDFSHKNLCGWPFKGHDLTDANFEKASIRGVSFTNANLKNANFSCVKAGLSKRRVGLLFLALLLLVSLSGVTSGLGGFLVFFLLTNESIRLSGTSGMTVLLSLFVLLFTTNYKGFAVGLTAGVLILIPSLILGAVFTNTNDIASIGIAFFVGGAAEFAIASSYIGAAVSIAGAMAIFSSVPMAIGMAGMFSFALVSAATLQTPIAVPTTVIICLFGNYTAWRARAGDEKFAWIRNSAVAFAATGGTSFHGANLTDANFTQATLKNTDFRGANLTRTCWHQAKKLDLARVGNSILSKPSVRNLLVSRNGYKKSFVGENLQGANLTGANLNEVNLKEADISGATLQEAELKWANLTKSQAINTNFRKAYLTGACLEAWNIDSTTILEQVDCQYVFFREHPHPITGDKERRPHDPDKIFEPGDFEKLYKKIMNTVQILLRNGINKEAFAVAFQKLMEENPEITPDSIQGVEKKDNDVLLTLQVPEGTDKAKIERDFNEPYKLEAQKQAALLEAEVRHSREMKEVTMTLASNLSNLLSNLTIIASGETTTMTNNNPSITSGAGSFINLGEGNSMAMTGSNFLSEISGNVTNAVNQLPAAPEPDKPGIKELLTELQTLIEAETNLTDKNKEKALKQVKALAEAAQNPKEPEKQDLADTAITMLKGLITGLPSAATLVEACNKLLPAIASLLGLG
jgi:uncharacterized protein YjbI with pentapeptide repeats